jgi:hypothetical protein
VNFVTWRKYESKTCSLFKGNETSPRQHRVNRHKEAIQVFAVVKNLNCTVREEEVDGPECEVYMCCVLLAMIFQYFTFKLSLIRYFTLQSNFKD